MAALRRVARLEQPGDPEIQQLRHAIRADQDVRGLDVAVDDGAAMRIGDGRAHLAKELQPFGDVECLLVAIVVDRQPLDVLHDEVRQAVLGRVAVEQARDVRVIEAGEDLPLVAEAAQHGLRVHAALDELDGDLLLVLAVGAPREIDRAHPAAADPLQDLPVADDLADQAVGVPRRRRAARRASRSAFR